MKYSIVILFLLTGSLLSFAQHKDKGEPAISTTKEVQFWVNGVCGMCKNTIEKSLDVKGVKYAEWDIKTGITTVIYRSDKVSMETLKQQISKAGYETKDVKADAKAYNDLPFCCKYKTVKKH